MKKVRNETEANGAANRTVSQNSQGMHSQKQRRKRTTGMLAAVLALVLLMSGTFAWYYLANAVNEFDGRRLSDDDDSAILHDDYDEEGEDGVHDKQVYVENTGENELYVRLRLDEYMEINYNPLVNGTTKANLDSWLAHIPHSTDPADPANMADDPFHAYWEWKLGGSTEYAPGAAGKSGVVSRYDSNGNDTLIAGAAGNETTPNAEVITMADYQNRRALTTTDPNHIDATTWEGWIYDTDGYAYWSQRLAPGEATGLLLDQVKKLFTSTDGGLYYYGINVVMETVDEDDLAAWLTGTETTNGKYPDAATTEAVEFLVSISAGQEAELIKAELKTKNVGETIEISAIEWVVIAKDNDSVELMSADMIVESVFNADGTYDWADSDLRAYLREDYRKSLSTVLQSLITETEKETPTAYNDATIVTTKETIYVLSETEADDLERAHPGLLACAGASGINRNYYWLRSPGDAAGEAGQVRTTTGAISSTDADDTRGVRPVVTIGLD